MTPIREKKNKPVEILTIKVIVDETSISTAKERENFFIGYIDNIPGCEVHYTKVEKAEVINL
jgi:hypothetical protein